MGRGMQLDLGQFDPNLLLLLAPHSSCWMTDGLTTSHRRMPDATCDAGADGVKGRVAPR
jgi:hypothetical protein